MVRELLGQGYLLHIMKFLKYFTYSVKSSLFKECGLYVAVVAVHFNSNFLVLSLCKIKEVRDERHAGYRERQTPNPQPSSQDLTVARK